MKILFLVSSLLSASVGSSLASAEWIKIAEGYDNDTWYLDSATLTGTLVRRGWFMVTYSTARPNGMLSAKSFEEFSCRERRNRILSLTYFNGAMGAGRVIYGDSKPSGWDDVAPDSIAEAMMKKACENGT
jgi:hypothetical protein